MTEENVKKLKSFRRKLVKQIKKKKGKPDVHRM